MIMKTIRIPSLWHEVLGTESTLMELLLVFTVSPVATLALFGITHPEWSILANWQAAVLLLLVFDIFAGFIANLTFSTNKFYKDSPKARLVFIVLHIQPLIFSFLFGDFILTCLLVWGYTAVAAFIINALQSYPAQKPVAGSFVAIGLVGLLLSSAELPLILLVALTFYQLKVIYSFAVEHYASREI